MAEKKRILIVDDNHSLVLGAQLLLKQNDFDVSTAYDGAQGLEKALTEKPDLIILDINMPVMNGYEVCRRLRSEPDTARIPIIILSARGEVDEQKSAVVVGLQEVYEGYDLGANNFLTKPVTAQELLDAVKTELSFSSFLQKPV
jgi:two-component system alkaline phosphatase synthesis response regulator PhoP